MSLWQFAACVDGFNRAQSGDDSVEAPTRAEYLDMVSRLA